MKTTFFGSISSISCVLILFFTSFIFISCNPNEERIGGFPPEGQIWAEIENLDYTFSDASGTLPSLLNTYSQSVKSLSMYRITNLNAPRTGNFRVLLTGFDFDDTTPRQLNVANVRLQFEPQSNVIFFNVDKTDTQFEILSIENDIIKATFSATLQNSLNPNQQVRVRNGALNIRIRRE